MPKPQVVEVSFVFRGKDATENAEAFMLHMDTVDGIFQIVEGIRHFGGTITYIKDDPDQKLIILDGDVDADIDGDTDADSST